MTSKVEIVNTALAKLGTATITALTDDSEEARAANLFYEPTLRAELRKHPWNCYRKRATLAALSAAPAFGFDYECPLPSDFVRLVRNEDDEANDWQIEGRSILTNETDAPEIVYIAYNDDPTVMDPLLVEAFSCALALKLSTRITMSRSRKEEVMAEYKETVAAARKTNAIENVPLEPQTDPWILAML